MLHPDGARGGCCSKARRARTWTAALGAALCACGGATPAPDAPNLLLITVDTTRADHLQVYGYSRPTSPALAAFAEGAVVFERAYSVSSWTLPALASLMTGFAPGTHGCLRNDSALPEAFPTLAEAFARAGYRTAAVASHVFLGRRYGLAQGFDEYDEELVLPSDSESHAAVSSPAVTDKGLAWLARHARDGRPWLLWLHYFDPHYLYRAHPELEQAFGDAELVDLYDGEIAFVDLHLERLLAGLAELAPPRETVVALVADHGEELKDHGGMFHRKTLYEEVVRVPLLVRAPRLAPRRVPTPVSLVDLPATLLELCGLPALGADAGASLLPLMRGGAPAAEPVACMELVGRERDLAALVGERWKLVHDYRAGSSQLFDLADDPLERSDLAVRHGERVTAMLADLEVRRARARALGRRFGGARSLALSDAERRALDQLGYGGEDEERERRGGR